MNRKLTAVCVAVLAACGDEAPPAPTPTCTVVADCPAPSAACAEAMCSAGSCSTVAHNDRCQTGEQCDLVAGCLPSGAEAAAAISAPTGTVYTNGTIDFTITITKGSPDQVELVDNGVAIAVVSAPYAYTWDTSAVTEGEHAMQVRATKNGTGVLSAVTVTVIVDRTAPQIIFRNPGDVDASTGRRFSVVFDEPMTLGASAQLGVADSGSGVVTTDPILSSDALTFSVEVTALPTPPATFELTLLGVRDRAGNPPADPSWPVSFPIWANLGPATAQGNFGADFAIDSSDEAAVVWRPAGTAGARVTRLHYGQWTPLGDVVSGDLPGQQQPIGITFDRQDRLFIAVQEGNEGAAQLPLSLFVYAWSGTEWTKLSGAPLNSAGHGPRGVWLGKTVTGELFVAWGETTDNTSVFKFRTWDGSAFVEHLPDLAVPGVIEQRGLAGPFLHLSSQGRWSIAYSAASSAGDNNVGYVATFDGNSNQWTMLPPVGHQIDGLITGQNAMVTGLGVGTDDRPVVGFTELIGYVWHFDGAAWEPWPGLSKDFGFTGGAVVSEGETAAIVRDTGGNHIVYRRAAGEWVPFVQPLTEVAGEVTLTAQPRMSEGGDLVIGVREMPRGNFNAQRFLLRRYNLADRALDGLAPPGATSCAIPATPPTSIADTGCYQSVAGHVPAAGMIPYALNTQLWSDGAFKRRFIVLPAVAGGQTATMTYSVDEAWDVPQGTVLVKEFYLPTTLGTPTNTLMETRFLVRRDETTWEGYSYQWSPDGSSATLLDNVVGTEVDWDQGGGQLHTHTYPTRNECLRCHNAAAGRVLGLRTANFNRTFDYSAFGGNVDNQLHALQTAGVLTANLTIDPATAPKIATYFDEDLPLQERARGYLQANCAHCHRPGGLNQAVDFRFEEPFADSRICDSITAGNGPGSQLYLRDFNRRTLADPNPQPNPMPPLASKIRDDVWISTLGRWIDGMITCP